MDRCYHERSPFGFAPYRADLHWTGRRRQPDACHYAYQAEFIITLLAVIIAAALLVMRTNEARLLAGAILLLLGITVIVLPQPWAIDICPHGGACAKTTFFTTIGGSLLVLVSGAIVWLNWKSREGLRVIQ